MSKPGLVHCGETSSGLPLTQRNGKLYFYALVFVFMQIVSFYFDIHVFIPHTLKLVCENITLHETSPWRKKGWAPLLYGKQFWIAVAGILLHRAHY